MLIVAANVASLYRYIGPALPPAIFPEVVVRCRAIARRRLRDAGLITVGRRAVNLAQTQR